MLQIGEDVDYLLIPREVRLAGGVWRVISKPATKEAEFRERLIQFLQEEGRTLEDLARTIEKSTPHPPQPRKRAKEPRPRPRRVPQMVTPPLRLVVGTYDSSNGSDSDTSDFDSSKVKGSGGSGRTRKVRRMPVSYLGSKFLGSDEESEDDQELVEAFLRRGERPSAPPARRRVNLPVPMLENTGPQPSKADRWREYVSQVSWGKLKQRVKGWAPGSGSEAGQAQQASVAAGPGEMRPSQASPEGDGNRNTGDGSEPTGAGCWKPKIKWVSLRRGRKEPVPPSARGTGMPAEGHPEAAENRGAGTAANQRAVAAANPRGQRLHIVQGQRLQLVQEQRLQLVQGQRLQLVQEQRLHIVQGQRLQLVQEQRLQPTRGQRL
ncbi:Coiled-coil domain-containing protein 8 homolog [Apodemus speciosus]|uniref:Coiled-coil domain-containing protein 8 homolog n=1 Tax=Apodemus speciosus TaxID=105296 RepID=A0ABQ0EX55_APOSI